jgi:hypothetical protein
MVSAASEGGTSLCTKYVNVTANCEACIRVELCGLGVSNCASLHGKIQIQIQASIKQSNPITRLGRPLRFQEVEAPRFVDNRHMKVVRLSALRTGRLYPPGNSPGTHFC